MLNSTLLMGAIASVVLAPTGAEARPMSKCVVNGSVTYQQGPCPSEDTGKRPSVEELNAEVKARRAAAAATAAAASAPAERKTAKALRCDGRQYCSQMSSCDEAKYFLANCPGVKMDGDGNGIPCEQQWCTR
jgi:hypothetical protein